MDTVSVVLCSVIGLISMIYLFFKKKFSYWKERGVPYAHPKIPLGNVSLWGVHLTQALDKIYKLKDGGPFVGGYLGPRPIVVPTSLDFIQNILVKDFSSFHGRGMYVNEVDDPLGAHLFSLEGEKWKNLRNKLSPTFTSGKMKFMFPSVVEVADRFQTTIKSLLKSHAELEWKDLLARFTTDVIGTCALGIECNSLQDPNAAFRYYGRKIIEEPPLNPMVQMLTIQYPNLARKLRVKTIAKDVSEFFFKSVRETIDFREKNNIRRNDFMDILIGLKNEDSASTGGEKSKKLERLNLNEVVAQAFIFFLGGFETSSTTMMYSLYELALNQGIQDRARNEVNEVLARHEGKLTYEAITEMIYIDQIINESLRKYPPVIALIRKCTQDYKVPNSKVTIEKGTEILIPTYSIHRDPEIYDDPEGFDPDRFRQEEMKKRHPMSFLGFGDGPRNCIGLRFGQMQARIGLITLLKNFRFKQSMKTPVPLVLNPDNPGLVPNSGMHFSLEQI